MAESQTTTPPMASRELTLIVAATNKMGIGKAGTLPWTGLKKEMAYFARVTKRAAPGKTNAVIMGRKTWDSIPPKFRPLKDRTNIIITRSQSVPQPTEPTVIIVNSLNSALQSLASRQDIDKAFVIGGAQIYQAALEVAAAKRILLTRVLSDFDCDTVFPVTLGEDGRSGEGSGAWEKRSKAELDAWTGERVPERVQEENGTKYVFEMWEKKR